MAQISELLVSRHPEQHIRPVSVTLESPAFRAAGAQVVLPPSTSRPDISLSQTPSRSQSDVATGEPVVQVDRDLSLSIPPKLPTSGVLTEGEPQELRAELDNPGQRDEPVPSTAGGTPPIEPPDPPENHNAAIPEPEDDESLAGQIRTHERYILSRVGNMFTTKDSSLYTELGVNMDEELAGGAVVDFGSGAGGLTKSAQAAGIDTKIWSINPSLRLSERKVAEEQTTRDLLPHHYPDLTDDQLQIIQRDHDAHLSTNFAHNLEDFPDDIFTLGVDNAAVSAHMPDNPALYKITISEMLRVIKPGGKIIVGDQEASFFGETDPAKMTMKEKVLHELGIPYTPVLQETDEGVYSYGAIIYKPLRRDEFEFVTHEQEMRAGSILSSLFRGEIEPGETGFIDAPVDEDIHFSVDPNNPQQPYLVVLYARGTPTEVVFGFSMTIPEEGPIVLMNNWREAETKGEGHGTAALSSLEHSLRLAASEVGRDIRVEFETDDSRIANWLRGNEYERSESDTAGLAIFMKMIRCEEDE